MIEINEILQILSWTLDDEIETLTAGFETALNSVCGHLNYFSYYILATSGTSI